MYYMHTSFDLADGVGIDEFRSALQKFAGHMRQLGLVVETGQVAERRRHPIMDTDDARKHRYFFAMSFRDVEQCDAAVKHIQAEHPDSDQIHRSVYGLIVDPIFSAWED